MQKEAQERYTSQVNQTQELLAMILKEIEKKPTEAAIQALCAVRDILYTLLHLVEKG